MIEPESVGPTLRMSRSSFLAGLPFNFRPVSLLERVNSSHHMP
jgi:hypothetical protein